MQPIDVVFQAIPRFLALALLPFSLFIFLFRLRRNCLAPPFWYFATVAVICQSLLFALSGVIGLVALGLQLRENGRVVTALLLSEAVVQETTWILYGFAVAYLLHPRVVDKLHPNNSVQALYLYCFCAGMIVFTLTSGALSIISIFTCEDFQLSLAAAIISLVNAVLPIPVVAYLAVKPSKTHVWVGLLISLIPNILSSACELPQGEAYALVSGIGSVTATCALLCLFSLSSMPERPPARSPPAVVFKPNFLVPASAYMNNPPPMSEDFLTLRDPFASPPPFKAKVQPDVEKAPRRFFGRRSGSIKKTSSQQPLLEQKRTRLLSTSSKASSVCPIPEVDRAFLQQLIQYSLRSDSDSAVNEKIDAPEPAFLTSTPARGPRIVVQDCGPLPPLPRERFPFPSVLDAFHPARLSDESLTPRQSLFFKVRPLTSSQGSAMSARTTRAVALDHRRVPAYTIETCASSSSADITQESISSFAASSVSSLSSDIESVPPSPTRANDKSFPLPVQVEDMFFDSGFAESK